MTRRRLLIYVSFGIKYAIAMLFVGYGGLLGLIGLGPDGMISLHARPLFLCLFFGGVGLAYPFAVVPRPGAAGWIVLGIATSSLCLGVVVHYLQVPTDLLSLAILSTMSLLAIVAAITERLLSLSSYVVLPNPPQPQSGSPLGGEGRGKMVN